uniref:Uncharacterized protein n=1 Tax=Trichuris muris TaxID=70415 RepID=A0A5S6QDM0_TRIMR
METHVDTAPSIMSDRHLVGRTPRARTSSGRRPLTFGHRRDKHGKGPSYYDAHFSTTADQQRGPKDNFSRDGQRGGWSSDLAPRATGNPRANRVVPEFVGGGACRSPYLALCSGDRAAVLSSRWRLQLATARCPTMALAGGTWENGNYSRNDGDGQNGDAAALDAERCLRSFKVRPVENPDHVAAS